MMFHPRPLLYRNSKTDECLLLVGKAIKAEGVAWNAKSSAFSLLQKERMRYNEFIGN